MNCCEESFLFSTLKSLSQNLKDLRKVFILLFLVARPDPADTDGCGPHIIPSSFENAVRLAAAP
jgi:hypothetical protein